MQHSENLVDFSSRSADREVSVVEVKNRIVEEIRNAVERARDHPTAYDKGSYYKYGKISSED